ncbi:MAG: hypothetical protein JNJ71_08260 [Rubrivivax sp.]|nr:hypothetical protein [Rubrivivax sp.]
MSLFSPTLGSPPRRRQAASLSQTLQWTARRLWAELESIGQRRAAPELRKLADQLSDDRRELAQQLRETARRWTTP